jgi:YHS domain-containing protein
METKDPVCGMTVSNPAKHSSLVDGKTYVFCSPDCKSKFDGNRSAYMSGQSPVPMAEKPNFTPLALIFLGVIVLAFVKYKIFGGSGAGHAMYDFMGMFFVVFAGFKLLDVKGFAEAYSTYDIVAKKSHAYAMAYPFIELGLGLAYLFRWNVYAVNWVTFALMAVSSIGVIRAVRSKRKIQCACLGTKIKLPMTKITLVEDILMAVMALGMALVS